MDIFVFVGSTGAATRTSSSIMLAAGARGLGFEPLHIQVLVEGGQSALADVREVPFATATIKAERGERITDRIRARRRGRLRRSPVILDMPAQDVLETLLMLSGMQARLLVPMPEWAPDPERAVQDYKRLRDHWEHWDELNRQGGRQVVRDAGQPLAWIFPVGWPMVMAPTDLTTLLRDRGLLPGSDPQYQILYPGLPSFDARDLEFTDADGRFALTERQLDASARIAWPLCGDLD
ncbi:hypothetical protein [Microvirga guangxiensis]|uniref:Uncharacterized protein n=1 Tax=Microvirga guangxiensis TaxID=549386 RepID=A0A1G5HNU6_9HYPH|nr:hypothetical protein [Microvirga guangxiensis]SCY65456.1 hypothetical protein SAMN02927923_01841 [Microvirga guangxiensis]